jgi:pimeloyl-ACP methyl ester carboxylesterase
MSHITTFIPLRCFHADADKMLLILALTAISLYTAANALPQARDQRDIDWQPCPELNRNITAIVGVEGTPFECAKLSVPLDYTNPESEPLDLDLFRVNATKEPVLGTVLINFGGPGGSGAENLPVFAAEMAANIGEQWNLLSWDPRGTGKTIPFDCKIEDPTTTTSTRKRDTDVLASANLTEYFMNGGWESAGLLADACYTAMNGTGSYIGTAFVARDMMEIVDALGEDGLLRYYGWSYGTALGSYVAAMFPERIERVVLDANINPHDYQTGHYGDFLVDADKTLSAFLEECLKNKDECALAQYTNANETADLLNPINQLLGPLAANASTNNEAWTSYSGIAEIIYGQLYYPFAWPKLAETITNVLNGTDTQTAGAAPDTIVEQYNLGTPWAVAGIRASDALWRTDSAEEYLPQVEHQDTVSSFNTPYPSLWVSARWKMDAKERYKGDFRVKTKHPILYVNSEYDPATPLANAYNASESFEGSVVLPHSGYGHGIVVSPSECVAKHIQVYFKDGILPERGTHCEPDLGPWEQAKARAEGTTGGSGGNNTA